MIRVVQAEAVGDGSSWRQSSIRGSPCFVNLAAAQSTRINYCGEFRLRSRFFDRCWMNAMVSVFAWVVWVGMR